MPAMRTSDSTRSNVCRPSSASASSAVAAASAPCPRLGTYVARWERMFLSSSTMRTEAMRRSLAAWQSKRETRAAAGGAVEQDAAAVGLDDVAHDREAQTGAAD